MAHETDLHGLADSLTANARVLEAELAWFADVLDTRLQSYFGAVDAAPRRVDLPPPVLLGAGDAPYARFVREHDIPASVRLLILLGLIPHIRPQLLDVLWTRNEATQRGFTEFGGSHASTHGGFIPTGETAAFLLGGDDLESRFATLHFFDSDSLLARLDVLRLGPVGPGESPLGGVLTISREFLDRFTSGIARRPAFNSEFPARRISTGLGWSDLVLPASTLGELDEIRQWILHAGRLLDDWQMRQRLRPGFTALFHGPPGTGKTLAACLLGKHCGCDVYKVDLSMVVSKYIGETEKNLSRVFDAAERQGWILFFDEADALFGRRTRVDDAHDRFANQEISYLLQRIEEFDGVVILASNFKTNIDDAFVRRFQSVVYFPMPKAAERLRIWREAFPPAATIDAAVDLPRIAEKHELSGGTILNIVRYASLMAISHGDGVIRAEMLDEGVRRELLKEGRAV